MVEHIIQHLGSLRQIAPKLFKKKSNKKNQNIISNWSNENIRWQNSKTYLNHRSHNNLGNAEALVISIKFYEKQT